MLEDPYEYNLEPIRSRLKTIAIWVGLILFSIFLLAFCARASAEQLNQQGCAYVADVAITSRALAVAGVSRDLAEKILLSMYTSPDADVQRIRIKVTDLAYQQTKMTPKEYSEFMHGACYGAKGHTEKFLGVDA